MEIKQKTEGKKHVFYIEAQGETVATMVCSFAGDTTLIIEHTEVNPGNEGKGPGKMLVEAAVSFAREKGHKILPLCPYAKSVFDKTAAYTDVLFKPENK